jgi:hypothetical protein
MKASVVVALLGFVSIASATTIPATYSYAFLSDYTNSDLGVTFARIKITISSTEPYTAAEFKVDSLRDDPCIGVCIAGWEPIYSTKTSTYTWPGSSSWTGTTSEYSTVSGATAIPTLNSSYSTGIISPSTLYTSSAICVGAQEATFSSSVTAPTYELVADEDTGIASMEAVSGTGSSGVQLASSYLIACALKNSAGTMTSTSYLIYIQKHTWARFSCQIADGLGATSNKSEVYMSLAPEPISISILGVGILCLFRRRYA